MAAFIDELLPRIARCFDGVPRPTLITKTVAKALDDEWHLTERRRSLLYSRDRETRWQDLSSEELEAHSDIFAFLEPDGYLFYLPAFMSQILWRFPFADANYIDFTIYACAHGQERFQLFTNEQMRCVLDFLTFCAVNEDFCHASRAVKAVSLLEKSLGEQMR